MSADINIPSRGHRALRSGRFSEPNRIYHISTATINREPLFTEFQLGRLVVRALKEQDDCGHTETLAFVVMPDHLHWLVQLVGSNDLAAILCVVKSMSSRLVNRAMNRNGAIWQRSFHDHALRREESIEDVARYIVANPLRAGLAKRFGDYPLWDAKWL